jgi:two-component system, chemotaxis family, response regulator Rcp1
MFHLLVVDDSPADAALLRRLLNVIDRPHEVYFASDGVDALDFLCCRGPYVDAPRPNLILLDVYMPRMNGHEVLAQIKSDPELSMIPVIMLSTSVAPDDIRKAYQAHANCYVQKPGSLASAEKLIQAIEAFWMDVVVLPPCEEQTVRCKALSAGEDRP